MTTKFFTNADGNTLSKKLTEVFKYNPLIAEFDTLVGYFRSTGYFHLRPHLEKIEQIRILVGIDVDRWTKEAQQTGLSLPFGVDKDQIAHEYRDKFRHEIETAPYNHRIEGSVLQFIKDINAKKIVLKAHPSRNLHAKIYIFRPKDFNEHSSGEVITGSSNFTEAGLGVDNQTSNYEFNVSLRDYDDIKFATDEFEKLWQESVDILPEVVNAAKNETYLLDSFSTKDLYMKLLIEYFGKEIDFDPNSISDMPPGWKRLNYQIDAVEQGYNMLKKHNGFFLADVVGLGKTVIATLIARKYFFMNGFPDYRSHILIVCPPAVKSYWEETIKEFQLDNADCITTGSLHKIDDPGKYDLLVVDEAHTFRNDSSAKYTEIQRICNSSCRNGDRKRLILISATLFNNKPDDIKNQVLLFQDANNSTLDVNLSRFFTDVSKRHKKLIKESQTDPMEIKKLYEEVRLKIIEPLTVRRTRTDLDNHPLYAEDLKEQGIDFPEVKTPENLLYQLAPLLNEQYEQTVNRIQNENGKGLQYARQRLIGFLKPEFAKDYKRADFIVGQLTAIMKTLLIKRLDSSFHAFHESLERFVKNSKIVLDMWENDRIIIAPDIDIQPYIEEDKEEELLKKLVNEQIPDRSIKIFTREAFDPILPELLQHDHDILQEMKEQWQRIMSQPDPKLQLLLEQLPVKLLDPNRNPERKLVIFSEAADTTNYLARKLGEENYHVLAITAQNRQDRKEAIEQNFDVNHPEDKQKSEYDIIIATEALAEGVNLHRANTIVNYDTPWNAIRLIQRIGRINRIGGKSGYIYIYNFLPTEQVEDDIGLRHRAQIKLQAFHKALGEDSQIYTSEEEYESFGLFDQNFIEQQDTNKRLEYLMEIRRYRKDHPDEFKRIKGLPLKIRNAVADSSLGNNTLCFLRNPTHNAFYRIDNNGDVKELSFLEAVKTYKCQIDKDTKRLPEWHYEQVQKATAYFVRQRQEKIVTEQHTPQLTNEQRTAIKYLKAFCNDNISNAQEKQRLQQAMEWIKIGRSSTLPRALTGVKKRQHTTPMAATKQLEAILGIINEHISETEPLSENSKPTIEPQANQAPQIIISQSYLD